MAPNPRIFADRIAIRLLLTLTLMTTFACSEGRHVSVSAPDGASQPPGPTDASADAATVLRDAATADTHGGQTQQGLDASPTRVDGSSGLTLGDTCKSSKDCVSGICADGVCCDRACEGVCEACDTKQYTGTCKAIVGLPAPSHGTCGTGECGGMCTGAGPTCSFPGSELACGGAPACSNDAKSVIGRGRCSGSGLCSPTPPVACGPEQICKDGACEAAMFTCSGFDPDDQYKKPQIVQVEGEAPAALGGTIANGRYVLTKITVFGSTSLYVYSREIIQFRAPYFRASHYAYDAQSDRMVEGSEDVGSFAVTSTSFAQEIKNCNGFGNRQQIRPYTATTGALILHQPDNTLAEYTRQ